MPTRVQRKPSKVETPLTLRAYAHHGIDIGNDFRDKEITTECPFCNREEKFSINTETGYWRCVVCDAGGEKGGGGLGKFMEELIKQSQDATKPADYSKLAEQRGLRYPETLIHWGLCRSIITGEWLMPGYAYNHMKKMYLRQVYVWKKLGERMAWLGTPLEGKGESKHTLIGLDLFSSKKPETYICEGPWDGMRLWETLGHMALDNKGEFKTTSGKGNLLKDANVVAVPAASVFDKRWGYIFKGQDVCLLYDNDHPKTLEDGRVVKPAGMVGMKRAAGVLANKARSVQYLHWGDEGYDPNLESGYDLKDLLEEGEAEGLMFITERLELAPNDWLAAGMRETLSPTLCTSWKQLIGSWRKALKWTKGLDHALAVMLSSVASTKSIGDQLWIKVIGPASCGKSTLCEALSVNKEHILAKSTIRGFHSGYKTSDDPGEDNSLMATIDGKTLVTKDGDTLLQSPNLQQILSEARDVYDGVSRTHYRNKTSKDYEGFRMTWLLCGTSSLRGIDNSELGERFLDCVIMDRIDEEMEDEILWRVANKAADHVNIESNKEESSQHAPELAEAMKRTGGYIAYLKETAAEQLPKIDFDHTAKKRCIDFGKFVAYMRARPSIHQNEKGERELAARLVSQHVRLAKCLAFVLNENSVNATVLDRVRSVCLDTSRGVVLGLVKTLYEEEDCMMETKALALTSNLTDVELRRLVAFLCDIKVLQMVRHKRKIFYQLTQTVVNIYERVVLGIENE